MVWKVREVKKKLANRHDDDIVQFIGYCRRSDSYTQKSIRDLEFRFPKRTEFYHKDCRNAEVMMIKGNERLYCNRCNDFIPKDSNYSCEYFEHNLFDDLLYEE